MLVYIERAKLRADRGAQGLRPRYSESDERVARMWCPGCSRMHTIPLDGDGRWEWNDSADRPTFSPSILTRGGNPDITCHSFVVDGVWQYLVDCTHALAGQHVPMVDIPEHIKPGVP